MSWVVWGGAGRRVARHRTCSNLSANGDGLDQGSEDKGKAIGELEDQCMQIPHTLVMGEKKQKRVVLFM